MSKPLSAFYDYLLPELPGCSTAFVDLHLRQVAREFCEKTSAWSDVFPAIDSEPDTLTYFFVTADAAGELVRFTQLRIGGQLMWRATEPREPNANERIERPRFEAHRPPFTVDAAGEQITFIEQPEGSIELTGAMQPKLTATALPDVLFNQHLEAIRLGVLSRLMVMGGKKWSNPLLAKDYRDSYHAKVNLRATQAATGNTRAPMRTRPTKF